MTTDRRERADERQRLEDDIERYYACRSAAERGDDAEWAELASGVLAEVWR